MPGMKKPALQSLPQVRDRMTFLYLERCRISREDSAITIRDERGIMHVPAAAISVLMLGPGTDISHRAVELIGDMGVTLIWVGEHGVRYYASGRPLTTRAALLMRQAKLVSNMRTHLNVVRRMYEMRFPGEDVSKLTMQQLRGREGSRVRSIYRQCEKRYHVEWNGRAYDVNDFESGSAVNQALSAGNVCLYGLAHAVIAALGCSPGLGFVHVGHENSFVYDIADLYKAEIVIPLAFELAAAQTDDIASEMRRRVRDVMVEKHLLERMVKDVKALLMGDEQGEDEEDVMYLWDTHGLMANGLNYADVRADEEHRADDDGVMQW